VLEAVKLCDLSVEQFSLSSAKASANGPSFSHCEGHRSVEDVVSRETHLPAGVGDLATGLADYTRAKSVSTYVSGMSRQRRSRRVRAWGGVPFKLITSLMAAIWWSRNSGI